MILEVIAAAIVALSTPQYEITLYSEPHPMQPSPYSAIWLNPGETLQGSLHAVRDGSDWFYVHRRNWESGWLEFEYGKMKVVRVRLNERMVLAQ